VILVGAFLLLPGICALYFIQMGMPNDAATVGLFISGFGVALIFAGIAWVVEARRTRR